MSFLIYPKPEDGKLEVRAFSKQNTSYDGFAKMHYPLTTFSGRVRPGEQQEALQAGYTLGLYEVF